MHGYSPDTVSENIALLIGEGKPQAQAIAIALESARRAFRARFPSRPYPHHLRPAPRRSARRNPAAPSRQAQLNDAVRLYEAFTGEAGEIVGRVRKPAMPDVVVAIGEVDGILYSTVRDGRHERYIHEFRKEARPLFAVSHDGRSLYLLGGAYTFTDRGIVDTRPKR